MSESDNAWAHTLGFNDQPVRVRKPGADTEPQSKSSPDMCNDSPDTCHWYDRSAVAAQSQERFECRWCSDFYWD